MRVLHVLTALGHGGAEIWLLNLIKPLAELGIETGFALKAPHLGTLRGLGEERGARTYDVPLTVAQYGYVRELARIAREDRYDVIHTHEFVYSGLGVLAAQLARKPSVVTFHHYVFDPQTPLTSRPGIRQLREAYGRVNIRYAISQASAVTALSDAVMDLVIPEHQSNPRCHMLRLSAETYERASSDERARVRHEFGFAADAPLVMHAGRFLEQKNHPGLLRIFRRVLAARPDARMIVMGRGLLKEQIMKSAKDLTDRGAVVFLEPRNDVPCLMSAADVLLFPSLHEGFGLVALEANACGLPVVATRVPGLTEAVVDGKTALLHELADEAGMAASVLRLLENREFAASLTGAGRARAATLYSHEASAQRLSEVYANVLAERGGN